MPGHRSWSSSYTRWTLVKLSGHSTSWCAPPRGRSPTAPGRQGPAPQLRWGRWVVKTLDHLGRAGEAGQYRGVWRSSAHHGLCPPAPAAVADRVSEPGAGWRERSRRRACANEVATEVATEKNPAVRLPLRLPRRARASRHRVRGVLLRRRPVWRGGLAEGPRLRVHLQHASPAANGATGYRSPLVLPAAPVPVSRPHVQVVDAVPAASAAPHLVTEVGGTVDLGA